MTPAYENVVLNEMSKTFSELQFHDVGIEGKAMFFACSAFFFFLLWKVELPKKVSYF